VSAYLAAALGVASGIGYFQAGESAIPKDSNCSYLAAPVTDALALAAGALLLARGIADDEPAIAFIGTSIATIHAAQYLHHKRQ
jgi:hypothetical protein|tara:strand:- start:3045 stop:3296 length:252 start_codon:yes stop_codon:yes gene_type:complete